MQAVRLTAPGKAEIGRCPRPVPGPTDVLVAVKAVGVCHTDYEIFTGTLGYFASGLSSFPIIPGHEWTGEIAELGSDVPRAHPALAVGQHVVGEVTVGCMAAGCEHCPDHYTRCAGRSETGVARRDGAFADFMVFPARALHPIRAEVPANEAVLAEPLAVSMHALDAACLPSDRPMHLAIVGDGPIALLLLQACLALPAGHRVVVVGATQSRLERARELGAQAIFNVTATSSSSSALSDFLISEFGQLPHVVLEASGNPAGIAAAVTSTAPGGRVVLVGLTGGRPVALSTDHVVLNELTVVGVVSATASHWRQAVALLEARKVQTIVTHQHPLSYYPEAMALLERGRTSEYIKIILTPGTPE